MPLSTQDLIDIVERAEPLFSRFGPRFAPISSPSDDKAATSRLKHWRQAVASGDERRFANRLAWDGLDAHRVREAFASPHLRTGEALPAWVEILAKAVQTSEAPPGNGDQDGVVHCDYLDPQEPLPYEDIFTAFVAVARRRLALQGAAGYPLLTAQARADLERDLLHQLTALCAPALELEFSVFRLLRQTGFTRLLGQRTETPSRARYEAFVAAMRAGKLATFFREYSVLARLAGTVMNFWVAANSELLCRLAADGPAIQAVFLDGVTQANAAQAQGAQDHTELGPVVAVHPSLSDRHHQGRTVVELRFACGLKLIYKPKDMGIDAAYSGLLKWFNQHGAPLPFRILNMLNRSTHGWVEYVEHAPCAHAGEAHEYYRHAGALLCLLYMLEATDCHYQNLIASGTHPVLVDVETLMHHRAREEESPEQMAEAQYLANDQLWNSVLRTSLLPEWDMGPNGQSYDGSGLGALVVQDTQRRVWKWLNVNQDNMQLSAVYGKLQPEGNVPLLNGAPLSPNDYQEDLVDGFRQTYLFLMAHRTSLLAPGSPLALLGRQRTRFVFRATKVYATLLEKLRKPKYLRHSIDRGIELDLLSRALLGYPAKPRFWPLLAVELGAMEQGDIPYFATSAGSASLTLPNGQEVDDCFREPGYSRVLACLRRLDADDLERQIGFIRAALYTRIIPDASAEVATGDLEPDLDQIRPLDPAQAVQHAIAIGEELGRRAIRSPDGSAVWIGLWYTPEAEQYRLQPLADDLYTGSCGIALFLAALAHVTGDTTFGALAQGALYPLHLKSQTPAVLQRITKQIGIGGAVGLGSIIYGLVCAGELLGQESLWADAQRIAALITPEAVAADHKLDVMTGTAGALLGLLALYRRSADPAALAKAVICGRRLLQQRVAGDHGRRAWITLDGKMATGFSHGTAGIAYALLRLYEMTGDAEYRDAADEAIAYEDGAFDRGAGNWPDFGLAEPRRFMLTWCHGAPGIGLARLGGLSLLDTDAVRQDIEAALQTTRQLGLRTHSVDHLCCGNFGRIELWLAAAQRLADPEWLDFARRQAAWAVARAGGTGSFRLFPELPAGVYYPALFRGTAGIGYTLLRLAYPERLPSVLLWE